MPTRRSSSISCRWDIVADNETNHVALLSAGSVPVAKELLLQGSDYYYRSSVGGIGQKMKVGVFVQFENGEASRLGMPMPKGVVRVYKKDSAGNAQFVGEHRIDHTPKNERVRLKLGEKVLFGYSRLHRMPRGSQGSLMSMVAQVVSDDPAEVQ